MILEVSMKKLFTLSLNLASQRESFFFLFFVVNKIVCNSKWKNIFNLWTTVLVFTIQNLWIKDNIISILF